MIYILRKSGQESQIELISHVLILQITDNNTLNHNNSFDVMSLETNSSRQCHDEEVHSSHFYLYSDNYN